MPVCAGTLNRGQDTLGIGMVANDFMAFTGTDTTATEMSVIEAILKLGQTKESIFAPENKGSLIDQLA